MNSDARNSNPGSKGGEGIRAYTEAGGGIRLWPPDWAVELLEGLVVHPTYHLALFCPVVKKAEGEVEVGNKYAVFVNTSAAVRKRKQAAQAWLMRRASWLSPLVDQGLARRIVVEAKTRVALWLSSPSATELGICLHHVYGIPYLPSSSLKGLCSATLWREVNPKARWDNPPEPVLELFGEGGDSGHQGLVTFLDGIPLGDSRGEIWLDVDVMTPHHAQYYGRVYESAHDSEGPNPLPFLCIPPGQRFEIGLMLSGEVKENPSFFLDKASDLLIKGLSQMGLGAKTTSGYGLFEVVEEPSVAPKAEKMVQGPAPSKPEEVQFVATIIQTDRNTARGVAEREDGTRFEFNCTDLAMRLGIYKPDWPKTHGKRFIFRMEGDRFVVVGKEE